ncbi:MAG: LamG domain-containing protein [Planctomycetaceae bacterium]
MNHLHRLARSIFSRHNSNCHSVADVRQRRLKQIPIAEVLEVRCLLSAINPATGAFQAGGFGSPVPEPIASWQFDETAGSTAVDSVGDSDGTIEGAARTHGVTGGGLQFDGVNDRVTVGTGASLGGRADFTAAAWIRTSATSDGVVVQQRDSGFNGEYQVLVQSDGYITFFVYGNFRTQFTFSSVRTVNDGEWHHVAAVRSGAQGLIYIDGQQSGVATHPELQLLSPFHSVSTSRNSVIAVLKSADNRPATSSRS